MAEGPVTLVLALVAHTNAGKTTLARTLLGRDIGEVRDAPHVTEFVETHELQRSADGHAVLLLADTPGFGDSVRLAERTRQSGNPLGWLLSQVWDRWRDRAFWGTQQALRHVRNGPLASASGGADLLLYLVNASEAAAAQAAQLQAEFELLRWLGRPVLVLLNQLGAPRPQAEEQAELQAWRTTLAGLGVRHEVLPLDAFARCWVQEAALWDAVARLLPAPQQPAMRKLAAAWQQRQQAVFDRSMAALARCLAGAAAARVDIADGAAWHERLHGSRDDAAARAQRALQGLLASALQPLTAELLQAHRLDGAAAAVIDARVAAQARLQLKLPEGRAALWGGLASGALAGLKADLASGGLTMGGGALIGGVLGALGGAGVVRGLNRLRGTESSWASWPDEALLQIARDLVLRYLAAAHFGRGRGQWSEGEAPAHWAAAVEAALQPLAAALAEAWGAVAEPDGAAGTLQPLLAQATTATLAALYPSWQPPRLQLEPS